MSNASSVETFEPEFKLRASDPLAAQALEYYAALADMAGGMTEQSKVARDSLRQMNDWTKRKADSSAAHDVAKVREAKAEKMKPLEDPEAP